MKVVFVSNYFNHHQKPFCDAISQMLGDDFIFIATTVMRDERRKLGYEQDIVPPYVYFEYEGNNQHMEAIKLINNADVVIAGSAPNNLLAERIKDRKVILRYSERPFKKNVSILKLFYHAIKFRIKDFGSKNVYMLCASAYTAVDYAKIGMYVGRTYKWGYFPQTKEYKIDNLLLHKKKNIILWCGRFIDCKHPEDAILLAKKLKGAGYDFRLNIIGTGVMEQELKQLVSSFELTEQIHFLGAMPPEKVRIHMEEAGIYLVTSDRQEGWGAVLNESMNSGCSVIASHTTGAVPFLVENNKNGLIYEYGNFDMLYEKTKYLLEHPEEQNRLGRNAYETIITKWNAEIATMRLLTLTQKLLAGEKNFELYQNGPCSRANNLADNWIEEKK